jgi:TonB family protein
MSVAYANPDLYGPEDISLRRYLGYSFFLHAIFAAVVIGSIIFHLAGNSWGDIGGGSEGNTKVNLVGNVGLPLPPQPPEITESRTFNPTDSLYKPEPPKPPEPKKPETKIQEFKKEKRLPPSIKSRTFEDPTPPPPNAVPGNGAPMKVPTGTAQTPGAASSGVQMQGQGGGDFASRYGWYVSSTIRRIEGNWDQLSLDAVARNSQTLHCAVTFTINRDGSIKDVHVTESSGNASWDTAGLRAVLGSNPMTPLPSDYSGSYVVATIDFPRGRK